MPDNDYSGVPIRSGGFRICGTAPWRHEKTEKSGGRHHVEPKEGDPRIEVCLNCTRNKCTGACKMAAEAKEEYRD